MDEASTRRAENRADLTNAIIQLLRSGSKKARFVTELSASLPRSNIDFTELEEALGALEAEGKLIIRDHFCADPHLDGIDLRIVGLIDDVEGDEPQLRAIREIDKAWDQWLTSYLANHRCG
jgi:hypothetical protein